LSAASMERFRSTTAALVADLDAPRTGPQTAATTPAERSGFGAATQDAHYGSGAAAPLGSNAAGIASSVPSEGIPGLSAPLPAALSSLGGSQYLGEPRGSVD
jgi:hypothetical protein